MILPNYHYNQMSSILMNVKLNYQVSMDHFLSNWLSSWAQDRTVVSFFRRILQAYDNEIIPLLYCLRILYFWGILSSLERERDSSLRISESSPSLDGFFSQTFYFLFRSSPLPAEPFSYLNSLNISLVVSYILNTFSSLFFSLSYKLSILFSTYYLNCLIWCWALKVLADITSELDGVFERFDGWIHEC